MSDRSFSGPAFTVRQRTPSPTRSIDSDTKSLSPAQISPTSPAHDGGEQTDMAHSVANLSMSNAFEETTNNAVESNPTTHTATFAHGQEDAPTLLSETDDRKEQTHTGQPSNESGIAPFNSRNNDPDELKTGDVSTSHVHAHDDAADLSGTIAHAHDSNGSPKTGPVQVWPQDLPINAEEVVGERYNDGGEQGRAAIDRQETPPSLDADKVETNPSVAEPQENTGPTVISAHRVLDSTEQDAGLIVSKPSDTARLDTDLAPSTELQHCILTELTIIKWTLVALLVALAYFWLMLCGLVVWVYVICTRH